MKNKTNKKTASRKVAEKPIVIHRNARGHAEMFRGKDRKWYLRVVARNGNKRVASQGYKARASAKKSYLGLEYFFQDRPFNEKL